MLLSKIPVIVGPTASGKTALALTLAKQIGPSSLISVDSRQAYQHLSILTGQDIPKNFHHHLSQKAKFDQTPATYFSHKNIRLWGLDTVPPDQEINLSDFTKFVWQVIKLETFAKHHCILSGGSGLYLKAITTALPQIHIAPNIKLRQHLEYSSVFELKQLLKKQSPDYFDQMNNSDQNNPRRLIRALELVQSRSTQKTVYVKLQKQSRFCFFGLKLPREEISHNIILRVKKRLRQGVIAQVQNLLDDFPNRRLPIYSSLGVSQITDFIDKKISKAELIDSWAQAELNFAKRQLTWFNKQKNIIWYDKNNPTKDICQDIIKWLNQNPTP